MLTHSSYLVIVSPPFVPSSDSAYLTVRNYVAASNPAPDEDITRVTVFDLANKLVAYSGAFKQGVREIVSAWGQIYILSNDGSVWLSSPS